MTNGAITINATSPKRTAPTSKASASMPIAPPITSRQPKIITKTEFLENIFISEIEKGAYLQSRPDQMHETRLREAMVLKHRSKQTNAHAYAFFCLKS